MTVQDRDRQTFSTIAELAARWRCSPKSVRRRIDTGDLAAHFINGRWLISNADRDAFEALRRRARRH